MKKIVQDIIVSIVLIILISLLLTFLPNETNALKKVEDVTRGVPMNMAFGRRHCSTRTNKSTSLGRVARRLY